MTPLPISLTQINPDEVLRYMGTPPDQAGADLRALVEQCAREVISAARPRWAYRVFDLTPEAEGVRLDCGLLLPGEDLKRHLRGCRRAALFCATLSAQVDGQTVEVPAALLNPGNYCVTAEGLATLLGATVTVTDGVLNIATK